MSYRQMSKNALVLHGTVPDDLPLAIGCSPPIRSLLNHALTREPDAQVATPDGDLIAKLYITKKVTCVNFTSVDAAAKVVPVLKLVHPKRVVAVTSVPANTVGRPDIPPPFLARISTEEVKDADSVPQFLDFASAAALMWCVSHGTPCTVLAGFQEERGVTIDGLCEIASELAKVVEFDVHAVVEKVVRELS